VEIGLALRSDRWAGADFWAAQAIEAFSLHDLINRCEVATVGIDGGGLDDLLGLTVIGREKDTRRWLWWSPCVGEPDRAGAAQGNRLALRDFEKAGDLSIVSAGEDVEQLADIVCELNAAQLLPEKLAIGVDPAGIGDVIDALTTKERGITDEQIIAVSQGWKLQGAIKTVERKLAAANWCTAGRASWPGASATRASRTRATPS
jgi:phage terminase large subunit-like protein